MFFYRPFKHVLYPIVLLITVLFFYTIYQQFHFNITPQRNTCKYVPMPKGYFPKIPPKKWGGVVPDEYRHLKWLQRDLARCEFNIEPNCPCSFHTRYIVILLSAVSAFDVRQAHRQTWLKGFGQGALKDWAYIFALGLRNASLQKHVDEEAARYGDILQGKFQDTFETLSIKNLASFRWIITHCDRVRYIVRLMDDVMGIPQKIHQEIKSLNSPSRFYFGCRTSYTTIHRKGKYAIWSEVEWGKLYPPYINGQGIIFSIDVARDMYLLALLSPMSWPDDIYFGALAEVLHIIPQGTWRYCMTGNVGILRLNNKQFKSLTSNDSKALFVHVSFGERTAQDFVTAWNILSKRSWV